MAACLFYHGYHSYSQRECCRDFCFRVLDHPRKRDVPLEMEPDPKDCEHDYEMVYGKLHIPEHRPFLNGRLVLVDAQVVATDMRFTICKLCGQITYSHDQLGTIVCHPVKYVE